MFQDWRDGLVVNSTCCLCKYSFHQPTLFQFKDTLIYIIDPLALNSLSTTLQSGPAKAFLSLDKTYTQLLAFSFLRILASPSIPWWELLKYLSPQQKTPENQKCVALDKPSEVACFFFSIKAGTKVACVLA